MQAAIKAQQEAVQAQNYLTIAEKRRILCEIVMDPKAKPIEKVRAIELDAKLAGELAPIRVEADMVVYGGDERMARLVEIDRLAEAEYRARLVEVRRLAELEYQDRLLPSGRTEQGLPTAHARQAAVKLGSGDCTTSKTA